MRRGEANRSGSKLGQLLVRPCPCLPTAGLELYKPKDIKKLACNGYTLMLQLTPLRPERDH